MKSYLKEYLINDKQKKAPALSLIQILEVSPQEMLNLYTAYQLIVEGSLTIEKAKALTDEQREKIALAGPDADKQRKALP